MTREHATYQGETIKQADVNLLAYPLGKITDPAQQRKDLAYYAERIDQQNGPMMSYAVLLFAQLASSFWRVVGNSCQQQSVLHDRCRRLASSRTERFLRASGDRSRHRAVTLRPSSPLEESNGDGCRNQAADLCAGAAINAGYGVVSEHEPCREQQVTGTDAVAS